MKVKCYNCGWQGMESEMLSARNPFDLKEKIFACPKCWDVEGSYVVVCDEPGCWDPVTCGTPTKSGYRFTCSRHAPTPEEE